MRGLRSTVPKGTEFRFVDDELSDVAWFARDEIALLDREPWVDRILDDADRIT